MINKLHTYCLTWSLKVNMSKPKKLVFRTGKLPSNLSFKYGDRDVEIVNNYKYLGVDIYCNLSFKNHLRNKLSSAKLAINTTWSKYINHPHITKCNKLNIFNAASNSIMLYAAQVWGFKKFDDVEKLLRFFIKKMLYLHKTTPNYVLHLETGLNSIFLTSLHLHFNYIEKVLNMGSERLPNILAKYIIEQKIYWAKEWNDLCTSAQIDMNSFASVSDLSLNLIERLKITERNENISKAHNSQFHDLYPKLEYDAISQLVQNFQSWPTGLILKARCGMLDLNARSFLSNTAGICSLCNLNEVENTLHFIGICPIFKSFRLSYFGKTILDEYEVICLLNGCDCYALYKYIEKCLNYRKLIVNEFN